ncbi:putative vacuolar (H+)-ATPase G subunit [Helianthus annuus]|nr:putative vacuolar (H+)-ATPase G subunit [Helianthus annuus]
MEVTEKPKPICWKLPITDTFGYGLTSGDSGANVKRLEKETEAKIQHLKTEADRISHDVVDMLLKHVTSVRY